MRVPEVLLRLSVVLLLVTAAASNEEATVDSDGNVKSSRPITDEDVAIPNPKLVAQLLEHAGSRGADLIPEQTVVNIATVITSAKTDPETSLLLLRMKDGGGQSEFAAFQRDMTPSAIVAGLRDALSEMEMAEILFQDPKRAVREMEKEGMIPQDRLKMYKKNPSLLADDTRKSLYFTFCSLAAAGGYL